MLQSLGKKEAMELIAATHTGMSEDEFDADRERLVRIGQAPELGRLFKQCTYRAPGGAPGVPARERIQDASLSRAAGST